MVLIGIRFRTEDDSFEEDLEKNKGLNVEDSLHYVGEDVGLKPAPSKENVGHVGLEQLSLEGFKPVEKTDQEQVAVISQVIVEQRVGETYMPLHDTSKPIQQEDSSDVGVATQCREIAPTSVPKQLTEKEEPAQDFFARAFKYAEANPPQNPKFQKGDRIYIDRNPEQTSEICLTYWNGKRLCNDYVLCGKTGQQFKEARLTLVSPASVLPEQVESHHEVDF